MSKLKLDLHEIYNKGAQIEDALKTVMDEAVRNKIPQVEIIPGKGSGQLKRSVIRFLERTEVKLLYHRYKIDNKNFGRIFVYFK